jgi:hypothetical protein
MRVLPHNFPVWSHILSGSLGNQRGLSPDFSPLKRKFGVPRLLKLLNPTFVGGFTNDN